MVIFHSYVKFPHEFPDVPWSAWASLRSFLFKGRPSVERRNEAMWCPSEVNRIQLEFTSLQFHGRVYGRYTELLFMGVINQRSHHWVITLVAI